MKDRFPQLEGDKSTILRDSLRRVAACPVLAWGKRAFLVSWGLALAVGVVRGAESSNDAEAQKLAIAIEALDRLKGVDLESNTAVKSAVYKVLSQTRGRPQFLEIVRDFKIKDQDAELLKLALKHPDNATGVESLRIILDHGSTDLVKGVLQGTNASQAISLTRLAGNTEANQIGALLQPLVQNAHFDPPLRQEAVRSLARVESGAASLIASAIQGRLVEDLKPLAAAELSKIRWLDLRAEAAKVLPPVPAETEKKLPPVAELLARKGDPVRGAKIYRRDEVGCIKCHQVGQEGVDFGPGLTEIGDKLGKDALYEAILNPSAGVSFGFEAWALELKNGDEPFGLLASETADEISIKAQTGIVTRYPKSEVIRKEQQKLSIMPAGLEQAMTVEELVDLVEYLTTLKKSP